MSGIAKTDGLGVAGGGVDACDVGSTPYEEALRAILDSIDPIEETERLAIRSALTRVCAEEIRAQSDIPGHRNSAMDGYACFSEDLSSEGSETRFALAGASTAGSPFCGTVGRGECIRVLTGAVVPDELDTVVMQEDCDAQGGEIAVRGRHRPGQFIRNAGDDLARGDLAIAVRQKLEVAELGVLASLGVAEVSVFRKPVVAFFSTGDELRGIGESLRPGDVYDSNRYTLFGLLENLGVRPIDMGVVRDDLAETVAALDAAANAADLIVTSAGASVGDSDFVKRAVESLGELTLRKVAMKPGRPLAFGRIRKAWYFGLPGNPVSVMVTFDKFVKPALNKLMGGAPDAALRVTARAAQKIFKRPGRLEFQRGILSADSSGQFVVDTTGSQSSGVLSSMSRANCYIVLPLECGDVAAGAEVTVEPFAALMQKEMS